MLTDKSYVQITRKARKISIFVVLHQKIIIADNNDRLSDFSNFKSRYENENPNYNSYLIIERTDSLTIRSSIRIFFHGLGKVIVVLTIWLYF